MLACLESGEEELPSSVLEAAVMETVRRQIEADMLAVFGNVVQCLLAPSSCRIRPSDKWAFI